jgi:hypothetical protein
LSVVNVQLIFHITSLIYRELWQFPLYTMMVFDQWHNGIPITYHITMSTRGLDTMDACFEWKHSQYSPIMASQRFHCWLCPRGNQLHQVKSLPCPPFYPTNFQLCIIRVTCPNRCNTRQHWFYIDPPSFMHNAFSFLWDYMAKHFHFLMFVTCEKNGKNKHVSR